MPLYTPEDAGFEEIAERHLWFANVLAFEYGEAVADDATVPDALNWIRLLPVDLQLGLDEADCSLAYVGENGYVGTIWDVTGPDDLPWAVFLADDLGPRLLTEFSLLTEEATDDALQTVLQAAAETIPARLLAGEYDRHGEPVPIPEFLRSPLPDEEP
ncbi:MAG: hypothetical protein SFU56_19820 [Capsulimonadales bacterium]|nr:hypothetical protein [Capsulimonadales bacterium]